MATVWVRWEKEALPLHGYCLQWGGEREALPLHGYCLEWGGEREALPLHGYRIVLSRVRQMSTFAESYPKRTMWLPFLHEIALAISSSPQHRWWGLVLAKTHPAQLVALQLSQRWLQTSQEVLSSSPRLVVGVPLYNCLLCRIDVHLQSLFRRSFRRVLFTFFLQQKLKTGPKENRTSWSEHSSTWTLIVPVVSQWNLHRLHVHICPQLILKMATKRHLRMCNCWEQLASFPGSPGMRIYNSSCTIQNEGNNLWENWQRSSRNSQELLCDILKETTTG